jgi:hypothetical protein
MSFFDKLKNAAKSKVTQAVNQAVDKVTPDVLKPLIKKPTKPAGKKPIVDRSETVALIKNLLPIYTFSISKIGQTDKYRSYHTLTNDDLYSKLSIEEQELYDDSGTSDYSKEVYTVYADGLDCGEITKAIAEKLDYYGISVFDNYDDDETNLYLTEVTTEGASVKAKATLFGPVRIKTYIAALNITNGEGAEYRNVVSRVSEGDLLRLEKVKFEGEDAFEIYYNDDIAGWLPKDQVKEISKWQKAKRIESVALLEKRTKAKKIYADIVITVK